MIELIKHNNISYYSIFSMIVIIAK